MKFIKPLMMATLFGVPLVAGSAMAQSTTQTTTTQSGMDQSNKNGTSPSQQGTYSPQQIPRLLSIPARTVAAAESKPVRYIND
jgi:hypothetical protein